MAFGIKEGSGCGNDWILILQEETLENVSLIYQNESEPCLMIR